MTVPVRRTKVTTSDHEPSASSDPGYGALGRTELRDVLGSDRRRAALKHLLGEGRSIELRSLIGRLADAEYDATVETTIHQLRQRVHVSLCRTHLPVLGAYDLATYDSTTALVSPAPRLALYEPFLEHSVE